MRNPLIKKQFIEVFRSYFVNQKTGKKRTKGKTTLFFFLFLLLLIFVSATFLGISYLFLDLIKGPKEFHWIYFAVMGILTMILGIFGSVFNTYASLYLSKDNELLLSLPISPFKILSSRIVLVYGLSLMYSGLVWLPVCALYYIYGGPSLLSILLCILLLFVISLFVTVLTCVLGFVVALLSVKLKNNSLMIVLITLAAIGGYYFVWFRMTDTLKSIVSNAGAVGEGLKKWGNVFYLLGEASVGDVKSFLLFTVISLALFAVCMFLLAKTFLFISTMRSGEKKNKVTFRSEKKQKKISETLIWREFKRFLSSPTYMLNCALGTIVGPIAAVMVIVKRQVLREVIDIFSIRFASKVEDYLPLLLTAVIMLALSMNTLTTPSISLEGKNFWILRALPVKTADILSAKRNFHLLMTVPTSIVSTIIIGIILNLYKEEIIVISLLIFFVAFFEANAGLMLGLRRSDFNWTNETKPIKQTLNSLLILLIGWAIPVITVGGYYLIDRYTKLPITSFIFLCILLVIFAAATYITDRWINKKGVILFEKL